MVAKNDVTGDAIQTRGVTDTYRNNYDAIFRKPKEYNDSDSGLDKADNLPEQEAACPSKG